MGRRTTGAGRIKNKPVPTVWMSGREEITLIWRGGKSALQRGIKCVFHVLFLFKQNHRSLSVLLIPGSAI